MKTNDWIELLARDAGPAPRQIAARPLGTAMAFGLALSAALSLAVIGPLPGVIYLSPVLWTKLAYTLLLASVGAVLTARLARPLARLQFQLIALLIVIAIMAIVAVGHLLQVPQTEWPQAIFGRTWLVCPWLLMAFSLPALGALLFSVRRLAPTRLTEAGQACGLLAGALGAAGYALACPESSVTFVAIWYTLGIGVTALLGRLLGPFVLRW